MEQIIHRYRKISHSHAFFAFLNVSLTIHSRRVVAVSSNGNAPFVCFRSQMANWRLACLCPHSAASATPSTAPFSPTYSLGTDGVGRRRSGGGPLHRSPHLLVRD